MYVTFKFSVGHYQLFKMSDSEEEFFASTQLPQSKSPVVSGSQKLSVVEYFFLVTFNWDLMIGSPFQINVLEVLREFPEDWITGPLTRNNRLVKKKLKALGGQFSLFCKVQKGIFYLSGLMYSFLYIFIYIFIYNYICINFIGTSAKLRHEMIRDLNYKYQTHIHDLSRQDLAYEKMIDSHPPRFLSGFTYEENPKPLRSQRIAEKPIETDVNIL